MSQETLIDIDNYFHLKVARGLQILKIYTMIKILKNIFLIKK